MSHLAKIERLTGQIQKLKLHTEEAMGRVASGLLPVVGGGAAGFLDAKLATIPNTNVSTAGVVGGIGVLLAVGDMFGKHSDYAASTFGGMLGYVAGCEVKEHFS